MRPSSSTEESLTFKINGEVFEAHRAMLIGKKVQQHGLVAKPELINTMGTMINHDGVWVRCADAGG